MILEYSILQREDGSDDHFVVDTAPNRGAAFLRAKELLAEAGLSERTCHARFFIAILEEVNL